MDAPHLHDVIMCTVQMMRFLIFYYVVFVSFSEIKKVKETKKHFDKISDEVDRYVS